MGGLKPYLQKSNITLAFKYFLTISNLVFLIYELNMNSRLLRWIVFLSKKTAVKKMQSLSLMVATNTVVAGSRYQEGSNMFW